MISIALAFLIGVLTLLQFSVLPAPQLAWLLLPVIVSFLLSRQHVVRCVMACLAGFFYCLLVSSHLLSQAVPPSLVGKDVLLTGRIDSFPSRSALATHFIFAVENLSYQGREYAGPGRVRLSWYHASAEPQVGERWQLMARLKPPHGFMNPGGYDYEAALFQQHIRATGYVRTQVAPQRLGEAAGMAGWQTLRYRLQESIGQLLHHSDMSGLLTALAIGEREGITARQWEVLRRTGTAHLMAISGLHIGLLASLGYWLGAWLWRRYPDGLKRLPAQKFAAALALVCAFTYAALAGFSIPTQRALIMVGVFMLAILRQRLVPPAQVLALALILVLVLDPLSPLAAGFWLSFAAVAVILYGLGGRLGRLPAWRSLLKMQWVVVLGLLPLTIGLFQQASLVSPLTNLLAIPVVSFLVVPLTLLACGLLVIYEPLASGLLQLAAGLMQGVWWLLEETSHWGFSQLQLASSGLALALAVLGILLLISPRGIPARALGLLLCVPLAWPLTSRPDNGKMWLALLDVGQGLAVVVQTSQHTLVYDTGPKFSDSFDTGEAVVAPYLRQAGIRRIDTLVVSHSDNDHIGGAASLQRLFPIARTLSSVPGKVGPQAEACLQGQTWQWDDVQFRIIHPPESNAPVKRRGNNRSCVLRIEAQTGSVLLTGDIEREAEQQLLASGEVLQADVLVVPHHGSQTSSSHDFITAIEPRLALLPVGYRNRYHLPSVKVMQRYTALSIPSYSTADSGGILLSFDRKPTPAVSRYRQVAARFWQHRIP